MTKKRWTTLKLIMVCSLLLETGAHVSLLAQSMEQICSFGDVPGGQPCPPGTVVCVKKCAIATTRRSWDWTIDKSLSAQTLTLSPGQQFTVDYTVAVSATALDAWSIEGNIAARNLSTAAVTIDLVDVLSDGTVADINCVKGPYSTPIEFPSVLQSNWTIPGPCTHYAQGTGTIPTTNTAEAHSGDTLVGSRTVPISQLVVLDSMDECVSVADHSAPEGLLDAAVCANDSNGVIATFNYSRTFGPYSECGTVDRICNTASFVASDTGATGDSAVCVDITVPPCNMGCTLTPGYWKTHTKYGPAPNDDTWDLLEPPNHSGEDTLFFLSGQTYYDVLWTPPSRGNAYYILAHAFIATQLNWLNGASSTVGVDNAYSDALDFFNTYSPASPLRKQISKQAIANAIVLDDYNNGYIGPGHCSE